MNNIDEANRTNYYDAAFTVLQQIHTKLRVLEQNVPKWRDQFNFVDLEEGWESNTEIVIYTMGPIDIPEYIDGVRIIQERVHWLRKLIIVPFRFLSYISPIAIRHRDGLVY